MQPEKRIPTHPGEVLLIEFLNHRSGKDQKRWRPSGPRAVVIWPATGFALGRFARPDFCAIGVVVSGSVLVCLAASLKAPSQEVPCPRIRTDPRQMVPTWNGRLSVSS